MINLADKTEDIITVVRGKEYFVVMKIEQYHYLREMELEAALYEARQDMASSQVNSAKAMWISMPMTCFPNELCAHFHQQL